MDYARYKELVNKFYENDNREENYQNRVLIPFLEDLFEKKVDVVDTSRLTKEWNFRNIKRNMFAGNYTPDILLAKNWVLKKKRTRDNTRYLALIEVKTPSANDRKHAMNEVEEYLTKVNLVILTDCVTWEFFILESGKCKRKIKQISLEKTCKEKIRVQNKRYKMRRVFNLVEFDFPQNVCKRKGDYKIHWKDDVDSWGELIEFLRLFV